MIDKKHLEEHISRDENDNKSHNISQSNGNNIHDEHQSIGENVLSTKKEQIEYSKPSEEQVEHQDLDVSDPGYVFGNEDDEEYPERNQ